MNQAIVNQSERCRICTDQRRTHGAKPHRLTDGTTVTEYPVQHAFTPRTSEVKFGGCDERFTSSNGRVDCVLPPAQLVALAGVQKGGTFSTYIGELLRAGFVEESNGRVWVTEPGLNYLGSDVPAQPRSAEEILTRWRGEFRAGAQRMLDIIVEAYPCSVSRAELSEGAGIEKGGTFSTYLGELKRAELVEERGDGLYAIVLDLVSV